MATYGYSTPYTGRGDTGPLPPGFMEAATAPGRNLAMGIAAMGQGLGRAIEQYRTKKAETEAATQSWETVSGLMQQQLASDPKYLAIQQYMETGALPQGVTEQDIPRYTQQVMADREMLNKFSALGEKFPDMSLAKKKAALGDAVMVLNQYRTDQQNQVRDALAQQQLRLTEFQLSEAQRRAQLEQNLGQALGEVLSIPTTQTITQYTPVEKPVSNLGLKEPTIEVPPGGAVAGVEETYTEMVPTQVEQPVGYQDRFKQAVDVFRKLNVPVNVDAITKALEATGTMRPTTVEPVGTMGAVVRFGDKEQFVPAPKADIGDMLKLRGVTIDFPEFRGTAPTEKEATDFRDQYSNVLSSRRNIQRLLEIAQMGKAMQQTPEIKAEAEQLSRAAQGALRLDIIGPGTVTDSDRKLLENIVRNPTDIFSLQSSNVKSLKSLLERAGSGIESKAKSIGLEVLKPTQQQPAAGGRSGGVLRYNPLTKKFE